MFTVTKLRNTVSIGPSEIGSNIYDNVLKKLRNSYSSKINGQLNSYVIEVVSLNKDTIKDGLIDDITASVVYNVSYDAVIFRPVISDKTEVLVSYVNEHGLWGSHALIKTDMIECFCPVKYIEAFTYSEKAEEYRSADRCIKKDTVIEMTIVSFTVTNTKMNILCSLRENA